MGILTRICLIAVTLPQLVTPADAQRKDYPFLPVRFTDVRVTDAFWSKRMEINRAVTIPFAFRKCEETGRIDNFAIAGGLKKGEQCGVYPFDDSDPYKIIEGASYSLGSHPDPVLEGYLDSLIDIIASAQEKDGYLYTARTNNARRLSGWAGESRWLKESRSHELYNAGHLYEAAAAHFEATGKRTLLDVALKNADLVARVFGPGKLRIPPGHQEIEIGLAKLYRVAGDPRFIQLAKFFLDERGHATGGRTSYGTYAQDHKPIAEQEEMVGHAVRALYMCSGMADVAALTGDSAYAAVADRLWANLVGKKLYLTGGVGSQGSGEGFTAEYDLPNLSAYCETCASIANVLFNQRLFLLHGDARYVDVLERTLYNGLIAGVALSGDRFFYPNPLASRGNVQRSEWFDCACCPTNIARFIPSIPGYVYATAGDELFVNLFIGSRAVLKTKRQTVLLAQETRYPWDGEVQLTVQPDRSARFAVNVRIPGWARNEVLPGVLYRFPERADGVIVTINGTPVAYSLHKGYARLEREWRKGDYVELRLPMPIRRIVANERLTEDSGRVALQRGPFVYCAEGADAADGHVLNLVLPDTASLRSEFRPDILNGIVVLLGKAIATTYSGEGKPFLESLQDFTAIPYYAWSHRGKGEMAVWFPRESALASPLSGPPLARGCHVASSGGEVSAALNDGQMPSGPADRSHGVFLWQAGRDTAWVQYDFPRPLDVAGVQVYWLDDPTELCRTPKSWRVLARFEGKWEPVWNPQRLWGTEKGQFNDVFFETLRTDALRLEVVLQPGATAGIIEWKVY
jgi:DUF1680 family protein